jgi:hypothetical protein
MSDISKEGRLSLDPGPKSRRPISACKCCLWTCLLLIGLLASLAGYLLLSALIGSISTRRLPHKYIYINATEASVVDIVKPLISAEQRFDIAATVWVRDIVEDELSDGSNIESVRLPCI